MSITANHRDDDFARDRSLAVLQQQLEHLLPHYLTTHGPYPLLDTVAGALRERGERKLAAALDENTFAAALEELRDPVADGDACLAK